MLGQNAHGLFFAVSRSLHRPSLRWVGLSFQVEEISRGNPPLGSDTTDWRKSIVRHIRMELLLKSKPRQDCFPVG